MELKKNDRIIYAGTFKGTLIENPYRLVGEKESYAEILFDGQEGILPIQVKKLKKIDDGKILAENEMKLVEYQKKVERTRNFNDTELVNYSLGLVCEAGEFGDIIKKHLFQGHKLDREKVISELGDVMWYLNNICNVLDINIEDVANKNIEKLLKRYPNGFSKEGSMNRIEKGEMK